MSTFRRRHYPSILGKIVGLSVVVGFITRIALLFNEQTDEISFSFTGWLRIFGLGFVNDICLGLIACVFLWLLLVFFSEAKYRKPWGYVILAAMGAGLAYVAFFNTLLDEYGSVAPEIACLLLLYKFLSFAVRLFVPSLRKGWRTAQFRLLFFVYVFAIFLNAVSEFVFWSEFGVRYNFIAVDYLIYTNEVIGNIFESYPMIPLLSALALISLLTAYLLLRRSHFSFEKMPSFSTKIIYSGIYLALFLISCGTLGFTTRFQQTSNIYVNELQANGLHRFYLAFVNNELEYGKFYLTMPDNKALEIMRMDYHSEDKMHQTISDSLPELHKNILLITVESLSASFLQHYNNTRNITPNIDRLMDESLVFNNLYATGNRTVRGLEAVTLCLPPSPGESIIKRPDNSGLFSTGKILKDKGYTVQFMYGGDSYFDNMETFFSGNGYEIIDKKSFAKEEITFANIWGVCDEDMYHKAIQVLNKDADSGQPFFGHIMTVSNHRPFTYPTGKIDIPADAKSRDGGVKYTDYALGRFMEEAKQQPWFNNTIFVIIADHCASSAGKTEIPLEKYHIPALIYAPGYIEPQQVNTLVSQIDVMPTLFGLLHFSYDSYFYGKNVFASDYKSRVFVATYQNMGYWEKDVFTVLSPVKRVEQYRIETPDIMQITQHPADKVDTVSVNEAIAHYQTAEMFKRTSLPAKN